MSDLCRLAFREIEATVTEDNIVAETFSSFAAQCVSNRIRTPRRILISNNRHSEIMAMGWEHLGAKMKTERTTASVLELIKGMEGGGVAHQADPLKFGLYNALRRKDPAKSTLARLRCVDEDCSGNKEPITHDTRGGNLGCPNLLCTQTMKCSECGHTRVDHCTWCKGCQRIFE